MKSILMSIQPKWVDKILNGEKRIEIRKRFPKDYRGWVYIYCTKDNKNELYKWSENCGYFCNDFWVGLHHQPCCPQILNGKVVARFYCENVERFDVPYPAYFHEIKNKDGSTYLEYILFKKED